MGADGGLMNTIEMLQKGELVWFPRLGYGFVDPDTCPINYGADYFENYEGYDASPTSDPLVQARYQLVRRHYEPAIAGAEEFDPETRGDSMIVDVGIGAGAFLRYWMGHEKDAPCAGFDIMPGAMHWLMLRKMFRDLYAAPVYAATFWDSLEHIRFPERAIAQVRRWAFVSMPIYASAAAVLGSKHFKPGEHIWYFTQRGLVEWFQRQGFALREVSDCEVKCGREAIGAFAFERVGDRAE